MCVKLTINAFQVECSRIQNQCLDLNIMWKKSGKEEVVEI
jgi:hypothetical protein